MIVLALFSRMFCFRYFHFVFFHPLFFTWKYIPCLVLSCQKFELLLLETGLAFYIQLVHIFSTCYELSDLLDYTCLVSRWSTLKEELSLWKPKNRFFHKLLLYFIFTVTAGLNQYLQLANPYGDKSGSR